MSAAPPPSGGRVWVPGYTKDDGTKVGGYWRDKGRGQQQRGPISAAQRQAQQALKGKR